MIASARICLGACCRPGAAVLRTSIADHLRSAARSTNRRASDTDRFAAGASLYPRLLGPDRVNLTGSSRRIGACRAYSSDSSANLAISANVIAIPSPASTRKRLAYLPDSFDANHLRASTRSRSRWIWA